MSAQFATILALNNDTPRGTFSLSIDDDGRTRVDACLPFSLGAEIVNEVRNGGEINSAYSDGQMMLIDASVSSDTATRVLSKMVESKLI